MDQLIYLADYSTPPPESAFHQAQPDLLRGMRNRLAARLKACGADDERSYPVRRAQATFAALDEALHRAELGETVLLAGDPTGFYLARVSHNGSRKQ